MPTLDWIGKKAVVNHHREVPYRLLKCDREKSFGDPEAGNLLVQGDNLEALKALLPYYAGKVKCIYIDPPYNTGNIQTERGGWFYNDNVDSPIMRQWLSDAVGAEGDDLSRHDKWLCMIYPRLRLLREFLNEQGVVFVSIDDNELNSLCFVLDEIFGRKNHVGTIVWKNATDNNPTRIATEHEYIVCYARNKGALPKEWKSPSSPVRDKINVVAHQLQQQHSGDLAALQKCYADWFKENKSFLAPFQEYDQIDFGGVFTGSRSVHNPGRDGYFFDVLHPITGKVCKAPLMGYRFPEATFDRLMAEGRIIFGKNENKLIEIKIYIDEFKSKLSSFYDLDGRRGANELRSLFPEAKKIFNNPKPTQLIADLISFACPSEGLVMDTFAGSGTTGHSVLLQSITDRIRRNFILVEMDGDTCSQITASRLSRAIEDLKDGAEKADGMSSFGGGFRYCTLGAPLFDPEGDIHEAVSFRDLAAHVFFCETGSPIPKQASPANPLIGVFQGRGIYLLYNRDSAGVASQRAGNVLTLAALNRLPSFEGERVIYAEGCTIPPARMKSAGVVFKQIPYQIGGL